MLHRVLATLLCVLGAAAIALGVASATLWRPADTLVASAQAADGTTLLVTDPGVLDMAAGHVTIQATGEAETVVVAIGRTTDVQAWVGTDPFTRVTGLADWDALRTTAEEGSGDPPQTTDHAVQDEQATPQPLDPSGSDLWVAEASAAGRANLEWAARDGRWSALVATTGAGADPPQVTLTWPREVRTPWLSPGVAAGSVLLVAGLVWWALILVAGRRAGAAEPEAVPVAGPVGLTRRQMRELEEQQVHTGQRHGILERFPALVPGPPRVAQNGDAGGTSSDDAGTGRSHRGRTRARREDHRSGRDGRHSGTPDVPGPAEPRVPVEVPDDVRPADVPGRPGAPAASADAWRRAWGLSGGSAGPDVPSADGAAPDREEGRR